MHALGHAVLALAAGASAKALVASLSTVRDLGPGVAIKVGLNDALFLATVGFVAALLKAAGGAVASYLQAQLSGDVGADLRLSVLDAWLRGGGTQQDVDVHSAPPRHGDQGGAKNGVARRARGTHGSLARGVSALTSHVREVEAGMKLGLLGGVRAVAQLVPLAIALLWLAPRLAFVAFLAVSPFAIGLSAVRRRFKRAHVRGALEAEALLEAADEAVRHADLWRSYGAEAKARASIARIGRAITSRTARLEGGAAALSGANEALGALALVLALAASRAGLLGQAVDGGALIAFAATFFMAYRPLRDLGDARLAWARADGAFEALLPLLSRDFEHARESVEASVDVAAAGASWAPARLELRDVRLARGAGQPLSFRVEPGAIVAVVGANGAGKTTLLRTLLGLDAELSGEITFGDLSLNERPAGPASRPFAWVPQDAPLLADTADANVDLAGTGASALAILSPLGAGKLAKTLDGARLGAGGRAISGGERQWIALARAIATRQPVLLLDEPTSGLDDDAQRQVLAAIGRLRGERSVIIVTHRPEPLAIADAVIRIG